MPEKSDTLKVFISYSRADTKFADEIVDGLEYDGGFDITIDRHSIVEWEAWKERLGALIAEADSIVFVLSPDSAKSEVCKWEVDEAERLSKRILPVLCKSLDGTEPPKQLAAINYINFTDGRTLMAGIASLAEALRQDIDWVRESTRLLNLALQWDEAERKNNRLLSGHDIVEAKQWLANAPQGATVTELHHDYIKASEDNETERVSEERKRLEELARASKRVAQRTMVGLVVAVVLAVVAGWFALEYQSQKEIALKNEKEANTQKERAQKAQKQAEKHLYDFQLTQSKFLSDVANQQTKDGYATTAILLGLTALPDKNSALKTQQTRPFYAPAHVSLDTAFQNNLEKAILKGHTDTVRSVAFSPDGTKLVSGSRDRTLLLWDSSVKQRLVDTVKNSVPRCLTASQRKQFYLSPEPPRWCYTMRKWPYDGTLDVQQGDQYLRKKDYVKALKSYQKAAKIDKVWAPTVNKVYFAQAREHLKQGKPEQAETLFAKARNNDPSSNLDIALTFLRQSEEDIKNKKYERAIQYIEHATKLDNNITLKVAETYNQLAWIMFQQGKQEEAYKWVQKAFQYDEKDWNIHHTRGQIYFAQKMKDKALADLTTAIELGLNRPSAFYSLGQIYEDMGDKEKAISFYEKAVALAPYEPFEKNAKKKAQVRWKALKAEKAEAVGSTNQNQQ